MLLRDFPSRERMRLQCKHYQSPHTPGRTNLRKCQVCVLPYSGTGCPGRSSQNSWLLAILYLFSRHRHPYLAFTDLHTPGTLRLTIKRVWHFCKSALVGCKLIGDCKEGVQFGRASSVCISTSLLSGSGLARWCTRLAVAFLGVLML